MDRMLRGNAGFSAFDLDRNDSLDAKEWDVFRVMLAAENGLLAIKLGGRGDMTGPRSNGGISGRSRRCPPRFSIRASCSW